MTKQGHFKTGVGVALSGAALMVWLGGTQTQAIVVALSAIASSSLPDNLEIKWWRRGERNSVIPHRTLTHWLSAWLMADAFMVYAMLQGRVILHPTADLFMLGASIGATGHILMDLTTPMGVPVGVNPFRRRSLMLLRSGATLSESVAGVVTFVAGLSALFLVLH
jgi:membrane-bound metal-dependent hydrolase YbcI (DUF457 family)